MNGRKNKTLLFIFAITFLMASCATAKIIEVDKALENGRRTISTKSYNLYMGFTSSIWYNLKCIMLKEGDTTFFLGLTLVEKEKIQIDKGRKLLIKFDDGSIMELSNFTRIGPGDYQYSVSSGSVSYYFMPQYTITEEQITKLSNKKVIKIRIEHDIDVIDRDITARKLNNGISEAYAAIIETLRTRKTIYTDF